MQNLNRIKAALLVLCIAVTCGCNGKTGTGENKGTSGGKTLAEVNGDVITTEDFKHEVENLPPYLKPMADTAEGKKEMLDTMVVRDLILQQARKDGIDKSPEVAAKLEDLKKRVVVEAYLKKKVEEQAGLSDADLQKFYDANKDKFKTGEQIRASHILVKSEKEAQDILGQLKKGGNFEELAKKYSTDAVGAKGGDLGWFSKGSMIPAFEKVAFGLKEGELSGIVTTQYGYHIIKLTGKRPAGIRPFAEVKDQIKAGLLPEKQQEVFKKLKDDLKKNAKISVKEDVLNELGGKNTPATTAPPTEAKPK